MILSEKQLKVVNSDDSKIVINACAAAGKSEVLTRRIQRLLNNGVQPEEIVAITFTNNAAQNMRERLKLDNTKIFIGTVHSYANTLLRAEGIDTKNILLLEQFDKLFNLVKEHPECIKPVKHLLWDEVQDSTEEQFQFILDYIQPTNYFLVGDWRQSIFSFRGARPDIFLNLTRREGVTNYDLNENYRNDYNILEFAKGIIRMAGKDYIDNSISKAQNKGSVITAKYDPVQLSRYIKKTDTPGDWFVLTRTNEQIEEFSRYLRGEKIPFDTFKRSQMDNEQLNKRLSENTVKLLTVHSAKGLEANNVAVIGPKYYDIEEKCIAYVAATRAKHLLVWNDMPTKPKRRTTTRSWEY